MLCRIYEILERRVDQNHTISYRYHHVTTVPSMTSSDFPLVPVMAQVLAENFTVYAVDLLGFGDSAKPGGACEVCLSYECKLAAQRAPA